jgi:hypothetical protein
LHSKEHLPKESLYETTTQVSHGCNPQEDNERTVKHNSTPENHNLEMEYPLRMESCTTSPLRRSDHKGKGQDGNTILAIIRKKHVGKVANAPHHHPLTHRSLKMIKAIGMPVRDNWWSMTQKQPEKQ